MKYKWEDLPEKLNCFTVRNASMINLNTGKTVRQYSTNTKIVVVQKCVAPECTYYRTSEAEHHYLNYAFKAADFGLPNDEAPSEHSRSTSLNTRTTKELGHHILPTRKTKTSPKSASPKDGGEMRPIRLLKKIKLFRRKNG